MGKHQLRLLKFAIKYPGIHSFGKDRSTIDALRKLATYGLIDIDWDSRQFKLNV